jgi:predicted small secreted protein
MSRILKKLVVLGMFAGFLAGCNTMAGLGKDVGKLGDKIENKAEEKKSY